MLVECGYVRAQTPDGGEYSFAPSFARIASLGHPQEIVALYVGLFGPRASDGARYVLACLCEQEDPTPLIGWTDGDGLVTHRGAMPEAEQIVLARHLMQHGICGMARPGRGGSGEYSDRFEAAQYVATARVHLGMSSADAENLSMSEFHRLLEVKFPDNREEEPPDEDEYEQALNMIREKSGG